MTIQKAIRKMDNKQVRYTIEDDGMYFVFAPRKRKYGFRMTKSDFQSNYDEIQENPTQQWHDRLDKAICKMQASGLWAKYIPVFENLQKMTKEEHDEICANYLNTQAMYAKYHHKYPFIFTKNSGSNPIIDWTYISDISNCILKSMYFGKYENIIIKQDIKQHLIDRQSYNSGRIRTNYDVSFEYNADKNMAWYSEEYKDCGNGHYYLAIDSNTAIFYEND